jgi:hypothetical protein
LNKFASAGHTLFRPKFAQIRAVIKIIKIRYNIVTFCSDLIPTCMLVRMLRWFIWSDSGTYWGLEKCDEWVTSDVAQAQRPMDQDWGGGDFQTYHFSVTFVILDRNPVVKFFDNIFVNLDFSNVNCNISCSHDVQN